MSEVMWEEQKLGGDVLMNITNNIYRHLTYIPFGWVKGGWYITEFILNETSCVEKSDNVCIQSNSWRTDGYGSTLHCCIVPDEAHPWSSEKLNLNWIRDKIALILQCLMVMHTILWSSRVKAPPILAELSSKIADPLKSNLDCRRDTAPPWFSLKRFVPLSAMGNLKLRIALWLVAIFPENVLQVVKWQYYCQIRQFCRLLTNWRN